MGIGVFDTDCFDAPSLFATVSGEIEIDDFDGVVAHDDLSLCSLTQAICIAVLCYFVLTLQEVLFGYLARRSRRFDPGGKVNSYGSPAIGGGTAESFSGVSDGTHGPSTHSQYWSVRMLVVLTR